MSYKNLTSRIGSYFQNNYLNIDVSHTSLGSAFQRIDSERSSMCTELNERFRRVGTILDVALCPVDELAVYATSSVEDVRVVAEARLVQIRDLKKSLKEEILAELRKDAL